jgi:hypothetical protein
MKHSEKNMMDWSEHYKSPMVENYHHKEKEFAGMEGKTLQYMDRKKELQSKEASKVRSQEYKGRYD